MRYRPRSPNRRPGPVSVAIVIKFLLRVVVLAAVFYGLTRYDILPGLDIVPNRDGPLGVYSTYLWIGLLFGLVNAIVGPIIRLLSLPFVLLTLGLFLLVVNAALLGLTAALTDRLTIDGFTTALIGGLILAVAGWVADQLLDR
jgi:putative membrane protein